MSNDLDQSIPYKEVLDNLGIAVAIFDRNGNYQYVNTALVNWRNLPRRTFLQSNVHDFMDSISSCVFDLVMEEKRCVSRLQYYWDLQRLAPGARLRLTVGTPIFDAHSNIQYVITMMQDVAEFQNQCSTLLKDNKVVAMKRQSAPVIQDQTIIAESPEFRQLLSVAKSVAPLDSTVLLYGESGCGKEVIANYIHQNSNRASHPMISLNCASFPENLIESELFGYEKGAFTGSSREGKVGMIEAANGGTLFLDEINSLSLMAQGKLLRTLEDKYIIRVGSTKRKKIDFRLIVASNQNLRLLVDEGKFREDLYYRLQVIPLTISPIRERRADIIPLCLHFINYYCDKYNIQKTLSPNALKEVEAYDWPGNVREIRNFAERIVVMTPQTTQEIDSISSNLFFDNEGQSSYRGNPPLHYPPPLGDYLPRPKPQKVVLDPETIQLALQKCNNNREKTANLLGISRRQLQYKIKEFHLSPRCRYEETT